MASPAFACESCAYTRWAVLGASASRWTADDGHMICAAGGEEGGGRVGKGGVVVDAAVRRDLAA